MTHIDEKILNIRNKEILKKVTAFSGELGLKFYIALNLNLIFNDFFNISLTFWASIYE